MNVTEIRVVDCVPFENYPFKIQDNSDMEMLIDSIKESGVLIPIVVRPKGKEYEILSGHRRIYACKMAGIDKVPAIIRELSRDEAVIFMVDSNLHREGLLPSEKGFAYKMKLEAMKHQGRTSDQVGQKLTSVQALADSSSDSKTQVQRYIRLTFLEKPLLDLVDEGRIALTPAVELSYLLPEEQRNLIETISNTTMPTFSGVQSAVRNRKVSRKSRLSYNKGTRGGAAMRNQHYHSLHPWLRTEP